MAMTSKRNTVKAINLDEILGGAVKDSSTKKSSIPVLEVTDSVKATVKKIRSIKEQLDSLSTELETKSAEVLQVVTPMRETICSKEYSSSVKVPSSDGTSITFTWKHQYSKVGTENEPLLRTLMGDKYDNLMEKKQVIKVHENISASPEKLTELIRLIGPEKFGEFFEVERYLTPTERYTHDKVNLFTPETREQLDLVMKQYKPNLKTK